MQLYMYLILRVFVCDYDPAVSQLSEVKTRTDLKIVALFELCE